MEGRRDAGLRALPVKSTFPYRSWICGARPSLKRYRLHDDTGPAGETHVRRWRSRTQPSTTLTEPPAQRHGGDEGDKSVDEVKVQPLTAQKVNISLQLLMGWRDTCSSPETGRNAAPTTAASLDWSSPLCSSWSSARLS